MRLNRLTKSIRTAGVVALSGAAAGAGLLATAGIAHAAPAATTYTFTTLNNQADPTFNQLLGINSAGTIAGYFGSGAAGHPNQGYTLVPPYGQANYTSENYPGSTQTQVIGINSDPNQDTAGFWANAANSNFGFVEWNGAFESFRNPKTPKGAGQVNQLLGINNAGIAVGFYNDANGHSHPYVVNQATRRYYDLRVPGVSAQATGINNANDVVGFATTSTGVTYSFFKQPGGHLTSLQFPGGSDTQAFGVNDSDQIVGTYLDGAGVLHGFVLSDPNGPTTTWQTIDDPNGIGTTVVNGINDAGQLVGFYVDAAGNTDGFLANP